MKIFNIFKSGKAERDELKHKLGVKESELTYVNGQLNENKAKYEAEIVRLKKENRALLCRIEELMFKLSEAEKKISAVSAVEKTSNSAKRSNQQGNKSSKNKKG